MERNTPDGHPLGLHRVIGGGRLPQAAQALNPALPIRASEMLIDVTDLQIDAASFTQLHALNPDPAAIGRQIQAIVNERGKLQNPVTGSGGMLMGRVAAIGERFPADGVKIGDEVATLVSLTATPLLLREVKGVDLAKERAAVAGHAILFTSSLFARIPADLPRGAVLAAFHVCGAPALAVKRARQRDAIFVLGLGKAGRSVCAALNAKLGDQVRVSGCDPDEQAVAFCRQHFQGRFDRLDARDPLAVLQWVAEMTGGELADFVIHTANVSDTEMAAILATKTGGRCLFFGMATNFQKAALGAESVGRDCELLIGSGYTKGHAAFMESLLRTNPALLRFFSENFG
jgi:L-erythro-3,5-diaminohexanoate dehydrogenase